MTTENLTTTDPGPSFASVAPVLTALPNEPVVSRAGMIRAVALSRFPSAPAVCPVCANTLSAWTVTEYMRFHRACPAGCCVEEWFFKLNPGDKADAEKPSGEGA